MNGPSNAATTWLASSGSSPQTAGVRAVRESIAAARWAATPARSPSPRTTGTDPASSTASTLAGLTNDSDDGRAASATSSSRSAVATKAEAGRSTSPRLSAATSTGTSSDHSDVRDEVRPRPTARGCRAPAG